jgi:hypothetical protein
MNRKPGAGSRRDHCPVSLWAPHCHSAFVGGSAARTPDLRKKWLAPRRSEKQTCRTCLPSATASVPGVAKAAARPPARLSAAGQASVRFRLTAGSVGLKRSRVMLEATEGSGTESKGRSRHAVTVVHGLRICSGTRNANLFAMMVHGEDSVALGDSGEELQ